MNGALRSLVLLSLLSPLMVNATPPANQGYQLRFVENFSGNKLNTNLWKYREDTRQLGTFIINALNTRSAVSVSNNELIIRGYATNIGGTNWNAGGGIISVPQFGYGYYECLSVPWMQQRGVHSAFWQRGGVDQAWEIDSCEIDSTGYSGSRNLGVLWEPQTSWKGIASGTYWKPNAAGTFLHEYEITPEGVYYWQDGRIVQTVSWPELGSSPQQVWMTALNGTSMGQGVTVAPPSVTKFKYFKYYAKDYPGVNLLANGSFEMTNKYSANRPMCWATNAVSPANCVTVTSGNAFRQNNKVRIGTPSTSYSATLRQTLQYLNNGNYQLTAMVKSSGGQQSNCITVSGYGGPVLTVPIPASTNWRMIAIPKIALTNIPVSSVNATNAPGGTNQVTIAITSKGSAGQWTEIDDVVFQIPPKPGQSSLRQDFVSSPDPVWDQGVLRPFSFQGISSIFSNQVSGYLGGCSAGKVGVGDAVSISFIMNVSQRYSGLAVSRLPALGTNVGWSVQMLNTGAMKFLAGSGTNSVALTNSMIPYQTNQPVAVTCTFNKGNAAIWVNGTNAANATNFPASMTDTNTSCSLGYYTFKGTLKNVRIDNRQLSPAEIKSYAVGTIH